MKKITSLVVLAIVALSVLCSCAPNGMSLSMVGLWKFNGVDYVEITNDGKFTKYRDNGISAKAIEVEGTISNVTPTKFTLTGSSPDGSSGSSDIYYEIGFDELRLSFNEGSSYEFYQKVK